MKPDFPLTALMVKLLAMNMRGESLEAAPAKIAATAKAYGLSEGDVRYYLEREREAKR